MVQLPLCYCCKHLRSKRDDLVLKCDAFPRRIPEKFTGDGEAFHTIPEPGDNDIQFEVGGNEIMNTEKAVDAYNVIFLPLMR